MAARSTLQAFQMPKAVKITGRTSTITNSFVNSIIPVIQPQEADVIEALSILDMTRDDVRCAYCGDRSTEWDHLRPLVKNKRPTGFMSEIANLVPCCGKCNQSKSGREWREWIRSSAPRSPATRGVADLQERIARLERYEKWRPVRQVDFTVVVGTELWERYWKSHGRLLKMMHECQVLPDKVRDVAAGRGGGNSEF